MEYKSSMTLKVLQVCAVDFTVRHFLLPLIRFLEHNDFEVSVMCSKGDYFEGLMRDGVDMKELPVKRSWNAFSHLDCVFKLRRFLKTHQYHIVHTHTPIASLIGRLAARTTGVPIVLYTAHGFYFHDEMNAAAKGFHIMLERLGARFCDFVFTQSHEDRRTAIEKGIIPEDRILAIGNGVDLERFDPDRIGPEQIRKVRADLGIPEEAPVVTIIGRLVREKGFFELFEAAFQVIKTYPRTFFLVAGDALQSDYDNSKRALDHHITQLGIRKNIIFAGMRSDIEVLLAASDIYTLPSYREGMPRSIIEAMAMGKPVVTTDIRGCREEVVHNETGLLVPQRDADSLSRAILTLLDDRAMRLKFGQAGRKRAREFFSEQVVLNKQLEVYRRLISEKGLGKG